MAGINLSQSIQEKQALARGSFFDAGFFVNAAIFLLVIASYGGAYWYQGVLEDELAGLNAESIEKTVGMKGEDTDRAKDLQIRLNAIEEGLKTPSDPKSTLEELEQSTLQTIRLTRYLQVRENYEITIEGVTTNLRYLAQQMLVFKRLAGVASVHVESVTYNKAGEIEFELTLEVRNDSEKTTL